MVIHDDIDVPSDVHTLFMMYFGQFTDHDLSRTAISKLTVDEQGWSPFFFMYVSYIPHCTIILTTFRYSQYYYLIISMVSIPFYYNHIHCYFICCLYPMWWWWWIFRQNPVYEGILMMRSMNWIPAKSLMSEQHKWEIWLRFNSGISLIKIHSLNGFCFYLVMFCFNIFLVELFIFYLKYYELF